MTTDDVATSPPKGGDMSGFRPDFAAYDVIVSNYQGDSWPEETRTALVRHVKNGGGLVIYPFACAAFPQWKEYNEIIDGVMLFLSGRSDEVAEKLKIRMMKKSDNQEFEKAAIVRDQIAAIESVIQRQKVVSDDLANRDIIVLARSADDVCLVVHVLPAPVECMH